MKSDRLFVFLILFLFLSFLIPGMDEIEECVVVSVISEPPEAKTAACGTGIVIDKENGLILTARHGVYLGEILNYKNEKLFKNIKVVDKNRNKMDGYVVHLSLNYDLAIIKVDHRFSSQADFVSSGFLKIRDKIEYEGFPGGRYRIQSGSIANTDDRYLDLDMTVVEGMSGGPLFALSRDPWELQRTIVGIVLLKQPVGGTALRSEMIVEYLSKALPQARTIRKKKSSLCLERIILNRANTEYAREEEPEFYFQVVINGNPILETEKFTMTGREIRWNNCRKNKFEVTLLPGDKIELMMFENTVGNKAKGILSSIPLVKKINIEKEPFMKKTFEALPQDGLPVLTSRIITDGNAIFLRTSR